MQEGKEMPENINSVGDIVWFDYEPQEPEWSR